MFVEKIKEFFKKLLDNSKVIIIILLCIILLQTCSRCSHNTKDQWKDAQYTEQITGKDSTISAQKDIIDSLNINIIILEDSLKVCKNSYKNAIDRERSLNDDKIMMREIIRNQNKSKE